MLLMVNWEEGETKKMFVFFEDLYKLSQHGSYVVNYFFILGEFMLDFLYWKWVFQL